MNRHVREQTDAEEALVLETGAPTEKEASALRPSLVPADVWQSWQHELALTDEDAATPEGAEEPAFVDASSIADGEETLFDGETGLGATVAADFEVALFALGQVSLFSRLDREILEALASNARQGELESGYDLFREEEAAQSFYVILDGQVEILRRMDGREVALRHLDRTEPVGLFGVLSGQRRAACARAIGDALLLEIPVEALSAAIERFPALRERLAKFYQQRLLEGFVGSSRLFSDVDSIARARIIGRFVERRLGPNESLVNPGEVSHVLAILISGSLQLESRSRPGEHPVRYELFPGEFVALTSAFSGAPCRLRVFTPAGATVVMLGHRELAELVRDYPALRTIAKRLPGLSTSVERDVFCGYTSVPGL